MHAATEVIGMMASLTSFLLWLPQGLRVWRHRHEPARLAGIAMSTQLISVAGNVLWTAYAVLLGSFWLGAPAIVNLPIAVATIVVLRRGAAASPARATDDDARGDALGTALDIPQDTAVGVVADPATDLDLAA